MTDAQYYIRKLSTLEGLQGPSSELETSINNIQIDDNSSKEDSTTNVLPYIVLSSSSE